MGTVCLTLCNCTQGRMVWITVGRVIPLLLVLVYITQTNGVSCGNHNASSCATCPEGFTTGTTDPNGANYCNGDCRWDSLIGCYGCACNGDGNGSNPPCSTDRGEGLLGDPEHRRWCYVDPGQCFDGVTYQDAVWSYSACYEGTESLEFSYRINKWKKQNCGFAVQGDSYCRQNCTGDLRRCCDHAGSFATRPKKRYGGGGSGAWKRDRRTNK